MNRKDIITLGILIVLTIITGLVSQTDGNYSLAVAVILSLSAIKFILVAFKFMELQEAHIFWKVLTLGFVILFTGIVILALV